MILMEDFYPSFTYSDCFRMSRSQPPLLRPLPLQRRRRQARHRRPLRRRPQSQPRPSLRRPSPPSALPQQQHRQLQGRISSDILAFFHFLGYIFFYEIALQYSCFPIVKLTSDQPAGPAPIVRLPPEDPTKEIAGTRSEHRVKMNRMRLKIAQRLKDAQNTNAMLTTFNELDMR